MLNFSTAFSGLRVAQRAIDVIATNMTNINTEGYHRQEVDLRPVGFNHLGNVAIGGVEIAQVRRLADTFLDREISRQQSTLSQAREELNLLQTAESAFGQIGAEGMSSTIGNFFNSLTELTADPTSIPLSMQVIWAADALAGGFRNLSQFVQNLSDQIDPMVEGSLNEINMLAEEVADLNKQITVISMQGGSTNLLKDRRDQAIHELAELAEVRITEDRSGPTGSGRTARDCGTPRRGHRQPRSPAYS
ncbi:MAG TPA: flagellar hook-associated protein FlgK, partial [Phycisphaerae bacterium]|nr:flagellar hook-associated protein FlgK [Phycisphaerae bacterium]